MNMENTSHSAWNMDGQRAEHGRNIDGKLAERKWKTDRRWTANGWKMDRKLMDMENTWHVLWNGRKAKGTRTEQGWKIDGKYAEKRTNTAKLKNKT